MSFYVVPGSQYSNLLTRATSVTPTPSADASFAIGYLYDGRANVPFRFGSIAADSVVVADLCPIPDPSFETGVSSWTAIAGTMDQSNAQANTGTYSARFQAAGQSYRDITARAGEQRQISAALLGDGTAFSYVRIVNLQTGKYLDTDGTWSAAAANVFSRATASWATSTLAYTVEARSVTLRDEVTLRITIAQSGAGTTYRDDVVDLPAVTWASIHGHNITPVLTPTVESSPDNSAWTTRITPTLRRDSFYGTCAAQYVRYWRLKLGGTPIAIPWLGEWVLGQYESPNVNPLYPGSLEMADRQERQSTPQGAQHVSLFGGSPQRRLTMAFAFRSDADFQQWERIYMMSRGGAYPLVVAPVEMDSRVVIMGRLEPDALFTKIDYWSRAAEFALLEEPLPLMK